jgi:pimeloyl-ACP methyl ester carboxylesterase
VVGLSDATLCKLAAAPPEACAGLGLPFNTGVPFLVQGEDYEVGVAPDIDAGGQTIQLKPLRPLNSNQANNFTPGTENGYLLFLTDGITDVEGNPAEPDLTYAQIRAGYISGAIQLPDPEVGLPPGLPTEALLGIFIAAHLEVGSILGIEPETVVVTASFTTLDTKTVRDTVADMATTGPSQVDRVVTPVPLPISPEITLPPGTPVTTTLLLGLQGIDGSTIPGEGDVYAGAVVVPYFLAPPTAEDPTAPLTQPWIAATESPLDGTSLVLNKFNPVPLTRADQPIPALITIPNDNTDYAAALGGTAVKPEAGWPVVIFYHGITRNRLDMLALTEPLNNAGYAVIAIDQPLHGIAAAEVDFETITPEELADILANNPLALLRVPGVPERTFDLDLLDNTTGAPGPDGIIDSSGAHYINLSNALVSRDNLRQAAADLVTLTRTIPTIDLDGDELPDLDGSRVHFIGTSLGGIAGTTYLAMDDTAVTATLGVPGGVISDALLGSFTFGPRIEAGLIGNGLVPNTSLYNNFIRDLQNLVDAGDPISHAAEAAGAAAIHFIQVDGDLVLPNSSSNRLAAEMARGGLTDYDYDSVPVLDPVTGVRGVIDPAGLVARVCFTGGATHGSQLDPGSTPESQTATGEMQAQQLVFIAGNPAVALPGNGQALLFGVSGSPLVPATYGSFADGDCNAPDRVRTNEPVPEPAD